MNGTGDERQAAQGIRNSADIFALVERTKEGWGHRSELIEAMRLDDNSVLAAFLEEIIMVNTAQLKVMGLLLERLEAIE